MSFKRVPQKFPASINTVNIGAGENAITLGGENILPLYTFDAPIENRPKIGVVITDSGYDHNIPGIIEYYSAQSTSSDSVASDSGISVSDVGSGAGIDIDSLIEIAKRAASIPGADFLVIRLEGAHPDGENKSVEECAALVKAIADAVDVPIAVEGCKYIEKDSQLLVKVAEALEGKNALLLSAREENYKNISVSGSLAFTQKVGAESSVDINLAKQLNVLIGQLGVPSSDVVMNLGSAAVGYGFEYVASTMERVRAAALSQDDKMLQMPVIAPVAADAWSVKEAIVSEDDFPQWGPAEQRGISMEISTAAACLAAGANAVILMHPVSVAVISRLISELM